MVAENPAEHADWNFYTGQKMGCKKFMIHLSPDEIHQLTGYKKPTPKTDN